MSSYLVHALVLLALPLSAHTYQRFHLEHAATTVDLSVLHGSREHLVQLWNTPSCLFGWLRIFGIVILAIVFMWSALSRSVSAGFIISCWMLASMAMNLVNKEVAVAFEATGLIVLFQMVFSAATFLIVERRNLKCGKFEDLAKWCIVPFFFAGMLITSLWSLKELSLSAVLILRNMLPICTFIAEKFLFDSPRQVSATMFLSMLVAFVGTIVYGHCNVSVTPRGVFLIMINCLLTVVDRLLQRHFLQSPEFSVSLPLCMVVNNVIGIFLTLGLAASTGEIFLWHSMVQRATPSSWSLVLFSCICGCCLGYLGLRCQKLVSATTFLVLQNFAKVFLIFVGMGAFGDKIKGASGVGCLLSVVGALWYGYERLPQETKEKKHGDEKMSDPSQSEAEKLLKLKKQYGMP